MFFQMNLLTVAFYSFDRPKEIRNLSGPAHGFWFPFERKTYAYFLLLLVVINLGLLHILFFYLI